MRNAGAWMGVQALVLGLTVISPAAAQRFSEWGAPVNLGPVVNSADRELAPFPSKDGLSLYFVKPRPGGVDPIDIYVSRRASTADEWGIPENLGPTINTDGIEATPTLSTDGHLLFFASNRPGGFGANDLYVSRRLDKNDPFDWEPPVNLGPGVNNGGNALGPTLFRDEETDALVLFFSIGLPFGRIYTSTLGPDGTFGPATLVAELSDPGWDALRPTVRRDGLEIIFESSRPGSLGERDLWVSTRESTSRPWSAPANLGPVVNSPDWDERPSLSFDGTALYFASPRPGGFGDFDIYVSTRTKLRGQHDN